MIKHGLSKHPLYTVRDGIIQRCYNSKHENYKHYGGRGIKVCDLWLNSVTDFVNWALKNGWRQGLEIDRIDNNGDYSPENCRILTHLRNQQNKRRPSTITKKSNLPMGVWFVPAKHGRRSYYRSFIGIKDKQIGLGTYQCAEIASKDYQLVKSLLDKGENTYKKYLYYSCFLELKQNPEKYKDL